MKEIVVIGIVVFFLLAIALFFVLGKKKECMETSKPKVIDTFTFFNELDILEKRLMYMSPYVDYFIISESPTTHSGNEKPFYFEQNMDRFSEWKDKIIYIKTKPLGEGFWDREKYRNLIIDHSDVKTNDSWERWEREGQQRFAIEEELKKFGENDIVIHSDLDEIPDMTKVDLNSIGDEVYVCKQRVFRYSFDYMVDSIDFWWHGPIICSNKNAKEKGFIYLRGHRYEYNPIDECGWHMTKFGTDEEAMHVLKNYAHSGDNIDFEKHTKDKTSWETGNPLINTSQEIKNSFPNEFLNNKIKRNRVLTIILAQTRSWELTWEKFKTNVLDELGSDLAVCISEPTKDDPFIKNAKYKWYYPEVNDWGEAIDNIKNSDWRTVLNLKDQLFGGIVNKDNQHHGSAGILLFFRWFLNKKLKESGAIDEYDYFIVTRSDYYYDSPHVKINSRHSILIPEGEDYGGITDRHMVVPKQYVYKSLSLLDRFIENPINTFEIMDNIRKDWNLEKYIKYHFMEEGIFDKVVRFPRMMYAVRSDTAETRWAQGEYVPEIGMIVKYKTEYEDVKLNKIKN